MAMNGKILVLKNDGDGFAKTKTVVEGMTVGQVFAAECEYKDPDTYRILLNGQTCSADDLVKDGDRVSITPANIKGQ